MQGCKEAREIGRSRSPVKESGPLRGLAPLARHAPDRQRQRVSAEPLAPQPTGTTAPIRATVDGNRLELIETGVGRMEAILDLIGNA